MQAVFPNMVRSYLIQSPIYLVWLVAIVLCIVFWRRDPRRSLLTLIALVLFAGKMLIDTFLSFMLPRLLQVTRVPGSQWSAILNGRYILDSIITAVLWVILLAAIFWTKKPAEPARDDL